jgi:ribonucleoside-diphosphate reductase beta chain
VKAHARLCHEPRNSEAKVDFVTIYHVILEGTLGVTTSYFLLGYLRSHGILPGCARGYGLIAADEGRHIAYGTQFLRQAVRQDPRMADVVAVAALAPAGAEEILGVPSGALLQHGTNALGKRLGLIGVAP